MCERNQSIACLITISRAATTGLNIDGTEGEQALASAGKVVIIIRGD
jgi:hypothetical protein